MRRRAASGRLVAIEIDPGSLAGGQGRLYAERAAAIRDLVAENSFRPGGRTGAFMLRLSLADRRLVFDVAEADGTPVARHILSLTPLAKVMKDYFLICESYDAALAASSPVSIEAVDMGRRGVHNEGAERLAERLAGKVDIDFDTARRLFTLVCALRWRG